MTPYLQSLYPKLKILNALYSKVTPGEWDVVREENCPEPAHESIYANGRRVLDTFNSEVAVVHECRGELGISRWDDQGEDDLLFVAAMKNEFAAIVSYIDGLLARLQKQSRWIEKLESLIERIDLEFPVVAHGGLASGRHDSIAEIELLLAEYSTEKLEYAKMNAIDDKAENKPELSK